MSHLQIFKSQDELTEHISMLRKEVGVLKTRLRPAGTGYLHTAIDVINGRIDELMQEVCYRAEDDVYSNLEGQSLPTLSKAGMKQKHGQAVMTVSEMMQDELEPLPINTFE